MTKERILKCCECGDDVKVGKYKGGNPTYKCGKCKNPKVKEKIK